MIVEPCSYIYCGCGRLEDFQHVSYVKFNFRKHLAFHSVRQIQKMSIKIMSRPISFCLGKETFCKFKFKVFSNPVFSRFSQV